MHEIYERYVCGHMHLHLYEEFDDVSGVKSRFKEIVAQVSDVVTKGCMDPTCARAANAGSRTFQA